MKKVVIAGGGFAGLNLAKKLSKDGSFDFTLVDINNYHFFPPLLYQVAASYIDRSNISYPLIKFFQNSRNVKFHLGGLRKVRLKENYIETESGFIDYDYLVLAMGTEVNYFGMGNIQNNALAMKTISDALTIRNHLLKMLEETSQEQSSSELNIIIAGG